MLPKAHLTSHSRISGSRWMTTHTIVIIWVLWVAATGALSAAKRSYPTSEVRGSSQEDPMLEGLRPRGVTPRLRSGAAAESARLRWHRNCWEEQPHIHGAVAARAQEGVYEHLWLNYFLWKILQIVTHSLALMASDSLPSLFLSRLVNSGQEKHWQYALHKA